MADGPGAIADEHLDRHEAIVATTAQAIVAATTGAVDAVIVAVMVAVTVATMGAGTGGPAPIVAVTGAEPTVDLVQSASTVAMARRRAGHAPGRAAGQEAGRAVVGVVLDDPTTGEPMVVEATTALVDTTVTAVMTGIHVTTATTAMGNRAGVTGVGVRTAIDRATIVRTSVPNRAPRPNGVPPRSALDEVHGSPRTPN